MQFSQAELNPMLAPDLQRVFDVSPSDPVLARMIVVALAPRKTAAAAILRARIARGSNISGNPTRLIVPGGPPKRMKCFILQVSGASLGAIIGGVAHSAGAALGKAVWPRLAAHL